ncbi:MAG TPA: Type 1 glutamine amidotransferase-like domain-containing protein, partial [Aquaticitalea sp.]|nr:Type 1 glutamine amidotransferase-like domain-containing protein [Aquaticitalea sp.]
MKRILIASTTTVHGSGYLEYIMEDLEVFFKDALEILFIPYARPGGISHDEYTNKASEALAKIGKTVRGIHEFSNPIKAIEDARGI